MQNEENVGRKRSCKSGGVVGHEGEDGREGTVEVG